MDMQMLINIGAGVCLSIMGWFARTLWDAVQKLESSINDLKVDISKHYVAKSDFADALREMRDAQKEIRDGLSKIYDKLDGKADK